MRSVNIPRLFRVRPDREEKIKLIKDLSIKEREEVFAAVARVLRGPLARLMSKATAITRRQRTRIVIRPFCMLVVL